MILKRPEIKEMVVKIAIENYKGKTFKRRPLMLAVEKRIRENGMWEDSDDVLSGSRGIMVSPIFGFAQFCHWQTLRQYG